MHTTHTRGRLFGKNVLEGVFRAAPDEDLFLGEILVGVDDDTGRRYLSRVVDVTYGTEHREPGWAERVAGTLLADDTRDEAGLHPLHEQSRRTYRVATCRCLGYLTPGLTEFRKPKSLPTQFSRVVAPEPADFDFLRTRMGDLPVGHLRSGETIVDFEVGIPGESLASHVGIFATTGMGKSNLMKVLAGGVMCRQGRYALLLVDPLDGRVVLVDVSGLGSTEEVLVASFLTRKILEEWSGAYLDDPERHERLPVVAIALEEAQRVLARSKDRESNVFPRVAREGRKFKVGLCAVTQQPKLLDDELLSQFNTFFVLGLADEKDRTILRGASKQDISALGPEIQTLMPGECLVANLHAPFAVPAKVHLYDDVVRDTPPPPARPAAVPANVSALVD